MSEPLKGYDPKHAYVRRMIGCGHGVLFRDYCRDCEIVSLMDKYRRAIRAAMQCRDALRRMGIKPPGESA